MNYVTMVQKVLEIAQKRIFSNQFTVLHLITRYFVNKGLQSQFNTSGANRDLQIHLIHPSKENSISKSFTKRRNAHDQSVDASTDIDTRKKSTETLEPRQMRIAPEIE